MCPLQIVQSESRKSKAAHRSLVNIVSCFVLHLNCTVFRYNTVGVLQNRICHLSLPLAQRQKTVGAVVGLLLRVHQFDSISFLRAAKNVWKKRFFDEKRKTAPLEEQINRLRYDLEVQHKALLSYLESKGTPSRYFAYWFE